MASSAQICGFLLLPERKDALTALSLTIGRIRRRYGLNACQIARTLKKENGDAPTADTIERAERMENELSLHLAAQLACLYDDCADPIRQLFSAAPPIEGASIEERLAHIEREAAAIRKTIGGGA